MCEQGVVFVVRESTFGEVSFAFRHANVTELIIEDKNTRSSVQVALRLQTHQTWVCRRIDTGVSDFFLF